MMRKTMAILGDIGKFPDVIKVFVKQDLQFLFVSEDEAKNVKVKKQLEHLETAADIEFISCEREGCWEADIIAITQPEKASSSLVEKINEVATQKIVLVVSGDKKQPKRIDFGKFLPHSKVVEINFDLQQKRYSLFGKNAEAKAEVQKIFEDSNFQLKNKEVMEVKIWSDVRCPFCYIGKKKFEAALEEFPQKEKVEVVWKSFQLDPNLKTDTNKSTLDYFVQTKGVSTEQAREMFSGATNMAREAGLNFKLEEAVPANSFMAHRLIQQAKSKGLGNEIEEALFKAHFEEAKNIDDPEVLVQLAASIGMEAEEVKNTLESDAFAYEVKQDELEARNIGVRGVPFFVFDDKYAVSGAQSSEAFLQTLEKSWQEYLRKNPNLEISEGDSCSTDRNCN